MISDDASSFITISGSLLDCNNEIETDGYAYVEFGQSGTSINVNQDGNFSETISVCEMQVTVSGISSTPFSQGTTTLHNISGVSELNVGTLITCW